MKKLTLIILSLLFISMYGCAKRQTQYDSYQHDSYKAPEKPKYEVSMKKDDFKKITTFTGNIIYEGANLHLRGWKETLNPNVDALIQIYVSSSYFNKWRSFEIAYDSNGTKFEIDRIGHDINSCNRNGCWFEEDIGITITKQYLEGHQNKEMKFQVSGTGGEIVITIPAEYTRKFLDAVK